MRNKIKKWLPAPEILRQDQRLSLLGKWLHAPCLWKINRHSVSGACAIGFAMAWVPLPMQMLLAAILAVVLEKNLPVAIVATLISNPITMAPMFYFAYSLGAFILGSRMFVNTHVELGANHFFVDLAQPFLLGCVIMAIVTAGIGYASVQLLWRYYVLNKFRQRRKANRQQK